MFVIRPNHKEFENQGVSCICLHRGAVLEMVAPIYKHLFVLTFSHPCFNVSLPPSFFFRKKLYYVCYWSIIMINDAVCRTKNHPAIQLWYPAVNCSRQVVSSFLPGQLGQVQYFGKIISKMLYWILIWKTKQYCRYQLLPRLPPPLRDRRGSCRVIHVFLL